MGRRELIGTALFAVLGLGGTAMTTVGPEIFPHHRVLIFWLGFAVVVFAGLGILALFVFPRKKSHSQSSGSVTAIARGRGKVRLGKVYSRADKLAHAEDEGEISAEHGIHDPSGASGRTAAKDSEAT